MTFAVSARAGLIHHDLFQGGMTAKRFNGFLNHVSEIYQPEMDVCLVFNNARSHMLARNFELPEDFNIKYLPPYSPFLNICENAFSIWKQALKTRLAEVREQTLDQPFDERMATLTQFKRLVWRVKGKWTVLFGTCSLICFCALEEKMC